MASRDAGGSGGKVRCAIYTRKSTEEGLEQEFNSLDAQYEACAAYVMSQRHEGWELVKDRYDDGGFSGGTMKRPGLQRLLADVAAEKVQVIVLYKIDRLTRSLSDFSRIVDVLDKAGASFVSVTQSFNTTTSMGRLMLNVLLSFAQFEREVTGERIRDKIAASKKKGMWMGGPVPLGYEVQDRKLVINAGEAAKVRHIFERYVEIGAGQPLLDELREQGIRTKRRVYKDGSVRGDAPFTRGSLFHLLKNRIYRGEMVHKGKANPGEHEAIIGGDLWERTQLRIAENTVERKLRRNAKEASLLAGMIVDGLGRKMSPSHTVRKAKRYRYYVTHAAEILNDNPAWRLPAHDIEKRVVAKLAEFLSDQKAIRKLVGTSEAGQLSAAMTRCGRTAEQLQSSTYHRRTKVPALVERVDVTDDALRITLSYLGFADLLGLQIDAQRLPLITAPASRVRKGKEIKLVISDGTGAERDETLVSLLREALAIREEVLSEPEMTIAEIAASSGRCRKRMTRLFRLSWIAPEIVDAILAGQPPQALTTRSLLTADLPLDWSDQKAALGF
ncbi:recombinase family protein [Novosphingobium sp. PY1]|uniref:recombinase family protein n=1 Tax=Novosphingobium sp. PY1 TaxID=1882221 RepID=UPI001A900C2A|nr:recombinase family protein [Novosphingobium sp. PY1]GFM30263.1 resolvase [Novosphingobium sp. PY1]